MVVDSASCEATVTPVVDLWLAEPERLVEIDGLAAVLDEEERARWRRLRHARRRREFLAAHALVRMALSTYAEVAPESWRFARTAYGRPEIAGPRRRPRLRFNLSHADGLVACAVARRSAVGVDVERAARLGDHLAVVERFFAAEERAAIAAAPAAERTRRFAEYWTLKEAYIKARGLGLALPLDSFAVRFDGGGRPALAAADRRGGETARWALWLRHLDGGHTLAVAVAARPRAHIGVRIRHHPAFAAG